VSSDDDDDGEIRCNAMVRSSATSRTLLRNEAEKPSTVTAVTVDVTSFKIASKSEALKSLVFLLLGKPTLVLAVSEVIIR